MMGLGSGVSATETGLRRRHSAPHDDAIPSAELIELQQGHVDGSTAQSRRTVSDEHKLFVSSSPRTKVPPETRYAADHAPRVRFSSDIERRSPPVDHRRKSSGHDESSRMGSAEGTSSPPALQPRRPELSIRTADHSLPPAAASFESGSAPSTIVTIPPRSPSKTSPVSPLSPKSRHRGYSLRRSLFNRSIHGRYDGAGSVIELEEAGPSDRSSSASSIHDVRNEKKQDRSIVTVSQSVDDDFVDELPPRPAGTTKHVKGTSGLPNYEQWLRERASQSALICRINNLIERMRKTILRIQEIPISKDGRHIILDASRKRALIDERTGREYIGNSIRSSRYTMWNFVPRQLWAQFSKLANFYFLCVSILQMIPGLSTTGSFTTIVPLLIFVCISIAKEGYDDLRRYRLDQEENNRNASVLHAYRPLEPLDERDGSPPTAGPIHWATTKWKNVQVGDVVKLERDEAAPADLVVLHSEGENGLAYIETMALDGETNLKAKQTTPSLAQSCSTIEAIAACNAHFVVEDPSLDLYNFEGKAAVTGEFVREFVPLTNAEVILRGSILRNTREAIVMVIYTGEECKIRMNANKNPRIKAPQLQFIVNRVVIFIVLLVITLAIFCSTAYAVWSEKVEKKSWYLVHAGVKPFPIITSFIILFNTMIPLSLYVSLEIIKVCQMFFLNDIDMYDEVSDTPLEARTSTINEELGQVSYIFSDKTGTLTDNSMKFRKLSVAGTAFLHNPDLELDRSRDIQSMHRIRSKGKGKKHCRALRRSECGVTDSPRQSGVSVTGDGDIVAAAELRPSVDNTIGWRSSARPNKAQPELRTYDMLRYIQRRPYTVFARKVRMFLLSIALCHTCLPEVQGDGSIDFQAASPDELALVRAAQEMQYILVDRQAQTVTIKSYPAGVHAEPALEIYEVLNVIEFSSKRKRMSVIVRLPDRRICIICKGADSIVMQRLKLAALANQKAVDIEGRASRRRSIEAREAIARKSEQIERSNSLHRTSFVTGRRSFAIGRSSMSGVPRPSMSGGRLQPVRNELDSWLKERETDVDASLVDDGAAYATPRGSSQFGARPTDAVSASKSSMQEDEDFDFLDESLAVDDAAIFERCFQHINDFATEGLRTLLYGYRFLDEGEYQGWRKLYQDATTSLVDRQSMIEKAGEMIESDLELLGATAIEDKLQEGVPRAIDKLRRANIKLWMLTGDKRETAINIGHSCRLIKDYSSVVVLDHKSGHLGQRIGVAILEINSGRTAHSVVVVDGQSLSLIEADASLQSLFFDLAVIADSVICCRASPSQKAGLVKAIRRKVQNSITLAIGDGANDIAMIQEAHVGIGITGKEGLQAARTSDYSIAQFRFLTKLLLVHGRWNYIRTCKYVVATFWKELLFYLTQALYQRWNGYTGTSLYESWSLSMFNTLFTSLPVIFLGVFEKDLQPATLLAVPELYAKGQRDGGFNFRIYFGWMFMASCEAMIVFFCMLALYTMAPFTRDQSLFAMGDMTFTACIVLISTKVLILEMHNKSLTAAIAFFLSVGGWFLWNLILAAIYHNNRIYDVKGGFTARFGRNAAWWLTLALALACCVVLELGVASLRIAFWPSDVDVCRELERDEGAKRRFEEASKEELRVGWGWGWDGGDEGEREEEEEEGRVVNVGEREEREREVSDLLARPRSVAGAAVGGAEAVGKNSLDAQEMFRRRFGDVRRD